MKEGLAKKVLEVIMGTLAEPDDGSDESAELKLLHVRAKLKYLYPPSKDDKEKMAEIMRACCERVQQQTADSR